VIPSDAYEPIGHTPSIGMVVQLSQHTAQTVKVNRPGRPVVITALHPPQKRAHARSGDPISRRGRSQRTSNGKDRFRHRERRVGSQRHKPVQLGRDCHLRVDVAPVSSRTMYTKEILTINLAGGRHSLKVAIASDHSKRCVLSVSDELHARIANVVSANRPDRQAAQTHDLAAMRRNKLVAHRSDANAQRNSARPSSTSHNRSGCTSAPTDRHAREELTHKSGATYT
jgi:hypothetical protein